jgi:hypothetical protein
MLLIPRPDRQAHAGKPTPVQKPAFSLEHEELAAHFG